MHEGHFTEQIVFNVIEELKKHSGRKPNKVRVTVGEVYHLVPESVLMHYEVATKGTVLEGVALELIEEPMQVECLSCQKQGPVEDHHLLLCSYCHSQNVKPVAGNKIAIEAVELE